MSDSPTAPAPQPPGDFTTSSFFTSPSTYLTLATYALPLLNLLFKRDVSEEAQAVANLAPIVATAVLLIMRGRAKKVVTEANLELAKFRAHYATPRDGQLEERVDQLEGHMDAILQRLQVWEEEEQAEAQLQEELERKVISEDVTVVIPPPADTFLFNGELVQVPRTKTGRIDGRTVVGKAALAAGLQ